jgi:peptidoglycan/xylan/chitin deacetylase (PgdA/CDA1 family)
MSALPPLPVFTDAPEALTARTGWTLQTILAPLGRRAVLTRDRAGAGATALAYASAPVAGVPTIPWTNEAADLLLQRRPLPPRSFAPQTAAAAPAVPGAFSAGAAAGFAVSFDLVASAFVLLACWDELTSTERDQYGRLPYSAGVFAAEPALRIEEPVVDAYGGLLRALLAPRLAELRDEPLPAPGWLWRDGGSGDGGSGGYAVALTHDLDNLWRWTPRGFAATGYRGARAARRRDGAALRRELGDLCEWTAVHLPRRSDPFWTFPQLLGGEDMRGVSSTFYVIASHAHRTDGNQPETYRRRIPKALAMLREHGREVGLHGNDRDRLGAEPLEADRDDLAARAGGQVDGIRYHYLRCLYHETLPYLEQAGFAYDTSLAFAEHEGFRCGTALPFRPFDVARDRPLQLVELPLAIMDNTLQNPKYRALPAAAGERASRELLERVASIGGGVSILWHNNRFDRRTAEGYDDVYFALVDRARADGAFVGRADAVVRRFVERTGAEAPAEALP